MSAAYAEIDADVFLLAGDLTRVGSVEEADCVVSELAGVSVPIVAVLGNHDHHADQIDRVVARLESARIQILEGSSTVVAANGTSVGIAGVKGFGGGFAGRCGSDFGEREMKDFVRHTAQSARSLEDSLASLRTDVRVALMHYAPVPDTLVGEPLEIYPFLGSYLLAEAVDRAGADLVLHGHAHRGTERGVTPGGIRVRNVAQPVIRGPYRIYELGASRRAGLATTSQPRTG
jgi:Icc-related predicted phosphoesterase